MVRSNTANPLADIKESKILAKFTPYIVTNLKLAQLLAKYIFIAHASGKYAPISLPEARYSRTKLAIDN
jgi:hypothetical protein